MKNKSLILKVLFPVAIGLLVGRFVTPLFGLESPWASIAISTVITITLFIIIESITSKLTSGRTSSTPMGEIKNLHKVNKDEIRQATVVLADAFKEDPLFKVLFGDAEKNSYKYTSVAKFMIRYCYRYGDVYASSDKFEGIMAITQDEYTYMSLWRMIRSGSIFSFFSIGFKSFMMVAGALSPIDETRKKHMKNKSFAYLQIIGVASENQGEGHGGKLLKELIAMTDEAKLPIYLETETESNVRLYERFGFKILDEMNLSVINQPMWTMLRENKIDE
ncbi:GNAT family N-acetyltransferase [Planococcus sp. CP5-4]|uniref:GNAT family N-acetyltransferase n=1 Tax=unclassified Planococcus (in: firmicutes) TaxID=2662419 RepID=UPI001C24F696|nr:MULTISPECIES: GNAT family N-acetyltransferase [unclassified Planococcus (in: firmicutes)]MBU9674720.1 GNAT family N-acetyltransferase [Planococcus sp. CP5-4_YE]MBV0910359.1 GNAT family N-acetyltransferase [Planococcus sp. CP5-4_UN]MBW6063865.1 GNAT family N-acetyltransferase [Planococcus sp. CP5-4]